MYDYMLRWNLDIAITVMSRYINLSVDRVGNIILSQRTVIKTQDKRILNNNYYNYDWTWRFRQIYMITWLRSNNNNNNIYSLQIDLPRTIFPQRDFVRNTRWTWKYPRSHSSCTDYRKFHWRFNKRKYNYNLD